LNRLVGAVAASTSHRYFLPALVVFPIACTLPSVWAGLYGDDYILLSILSGTALRDVYPSRLDIFNFFDGRPERTRRMLDLGLLPWWTFPEVRVAFWRPVSALTHWIDDTLWRDLPALMHLQNLCWLGGLIVAACFTYRRVMGWGGVAGLAALLYALNRTHAFPATDIVGRNTIIGALFGVLTVLLHDRWRRGGWRMGAIAAPGCLALALLASENAVASGAYVVAHAIFLERGGGRGRLHALLPHGLVIAGWHLLYSGLGYGVAEATPYFINPFHEPLRFAYAIAKNGPVLLSAAWVGTPVGSFFGVHVPIDLVKWVAAIITLTGLGLLLAPLLKRDAVARFWAFGQTLAVLPISASAPHDRYLLIVGFGAMGLLAQFLWGALSRERWCPERGLRRWVVGLTACALILINVIVSPSHVVGVAVGRVRMKPNAVRIPVDASIGRQVLVIVNAPQAVGVFQWFFFRTVNHQPIPAHTRMLASGLPPLRIDRADAQTVRVRWEGRQEPIFRPPDRPLVTGQRVRLAGTDVEVTGVSPDGSPVEAIFRFDRNLDDPRLRWIQWDTLQGYFVPFRPPSIGKTAFIR
jgi:hypothetical protein